MTATQTSATGVCRRCPRPLLEHGELLRDGRRRFTCTEVAERAARRAYDDLPRWQQLTTPPPPGLPGAWTARVVSRCAAMVRRLAGKEPDEL